jgi:ribosomal protein L12E/L44/L45/RPP1/RPP2
MRHVAAYLLLVLGGKAAPTAEDVKGVLDAAGVAADDNQLSQLISALEGKVRLEFQWEMPWRHCTLRGNRRGGHHG